VPTAEIAPGVARRLSPARFRCYNPLVLPACAGKTEMRATVARARAGDGASITHIRPFKGVRQYKTRRT